MSNQETEYLRSLSSFKTAVNEIGNYVVLDDIKSALSRLRSIDIMNGLPDYFLEIVASKDVKQSIELLSDSSKNLINSCNDEDECSQRILNDLNDIRLKEINTIEKWDELSLLFGLSSFRKLDIRIINQIISAINDENIEMLRDYFYTFLSPEMQSINSELESHDTDLNILISEILENRPKLKYSFSDNFDKDEAYFIDKIIGLNQYEFDIYKGSIKKFKYSKKGFLKFYTHNNFIYKINRLHEFELIEVVRKSLFYALKESFIEGSSFKIEINPRYSGSESLKLEVGNYKLISRKFKESKKYFLFGKPIRVCEIQLVSSKFFYCISIKTIDGESEKIKIIATRVWNDEEIYKYELLDYGKTAFNAVYKIPVYETVFSSEEELSRLLQITDNKDEANTRLLQAQNINESIDNLRTELKNSENGKILDSFLNNLVLNRLDFIDKNFLQSNKNFLNKASEICENYRKYLNRYIEPNELIKQIVIDANYMLYIEKEQSLEISKTMELLKDAYKHIDKLRDKKIVFFIGNTGSGKSTTVSYLLGAKLKPFINKVGDKVFEIDNGTSNQVNGLPKIGQSLGESETLYTQGYLIDQSQDIYLADCPGFNDTRGEHYELCSNLSIDQVIKNSKSICSLVIVLPIQSFILDRGNPIIDFANHLNDRFLNIFSSREFDRSSIFIIITKINQANNETVKRMKDGTRFSELRRECQEKINKLQKDIEIDHSTIEFIQKRLDIWNFFSELNSRNQIEFIDVLNTGKKRKDLLAKISNPSRNVDKSCYAPLMESADMKYKFGKSIELSLHTWRKQIINKFLIENPKKKDDIFIGISEIEEKIKVLLNQKLYKKNLIEEKKKLLEENLNNLKNFENAKNNPNLLTPDQLSKLEQDVDQSKIDIIQNMVSEIKQLQKDEKERKIEIDSYENSIKELNIELKSFELKKKKLLQSIYNLEQGDHKEVLFELRQNPDDYSSLETVRNPEIIEKAFRENRDINDDEISKIRIMKCSELRGKLSTYVYIERNYMLVPNDPKDREYFKKLSINLGTASREGFTAQIESYKFEPDYKANISPTGKNIGYVFFMNYDSGPLPWIKITWTIPNKIFNYAKIVNEITNEKVVDIKLMEIKKKIASKDNSIEVNVYKNIRCTKEIFDKNKRLHEIKQEFETENKKKSIEKFIIKIKEMAECLRSEINILEDYSELDKNVSDNEIELKKKRSELENLNKEFRNLSIIIITQLETAKMLRKLSNLIADNKYSDQVYEKPSFKSSMKESVILECNKYIKSYDKNIKKIEAESKKILDLVN